MRVLAASCKLVASSKVKIFMHSWLCLLLQGLVLWLALVACFAGAGI
ncbi:hypothetical protein QWZ13_15060 [Reinekea marina]|nr:hypothetical protein [Reinekea marina]MDN3650237.1 hypothetical protein [Reinekea marina]